MIDFQLETPLLFAVFGVAALIPASRLSTPVDRIVGGVEIEHDARWRLCVSVHSSLAMKWLVLRLPDAAAAGLGLSIDVREELVAFDGGDVDAGFASGWALPAAGVQKLRGWLKEQVRLTIA